MLEEMHFNFPARSISRTDEIFAFGIFAMTESMKLIVDGYIRLKNRSALQQLKDHRRWLRQGLEERSKGWFDLSRSIRQFDKDILTIEAALQELERMESRP